MQIVHINVFQRKYGFIEVILKDIASYVTYILEKDNRPKKFIETVYIQAFVMKI